MKICIISPHMCLAIINSRIRLFIINPNMTQAKYYLCKTETNFKIDLYIPTTYLNQVQMMNAFQNYYTFYTSRDILPHIYIFYLSMVQLKWIKLKISKLCYIEKT